MHINNINKIYDNIIKDPNFNILNRHLIIKEKINFIKFNVEYIEDNLIFKNNKGQVIDDLFLTLNKLYEYPINYIINNKINIFRNNYRYGFRLYVEDLYENKEYNKPKNNLIITDILHIPTNNIVDGQYILKNIANSLNIDYLPILFDGFMNENFQIDIINFITQNKKFNINKYLDNNIYMSNSKEFIFTFKDNFENATYKLNLNTTKNEKIKHESSDLYKLILIDLYDFLVDYDYNKIKKYNSTISNICNIFNDYITNNKNKYEDVNVDTNSIFNKYEIFSVNLDRVVNINTKWLITTSKINEYIFKVLLNIFIDGNLKSDNILIDDKLLKKIKQKRNKILNNFSKKSQSSRSVGG